MRFQLSCKAKSVREVNGLVSTVPMLCNDIGMDFEIRKCGIPEESNVM